MSDYYEDNWLRIGIVVAVAALAGFLVWMFLIRDDDDGPDLPGTVVTTEVGPFGPALAGPDELRDAAAQVGHPVYWAGKGENGDLELTLTSDGRTFVRYLTDGAAAGVETADFLTVATYAVANAEAALEEVAAREGRETFVIPSGGVGVADPAEPTRVYFSPAGLDLQVEVFDPEPGRARQLVESGEIEPIG